jgi:hypothetical protein
MHCLTEILQRERETGERRHSGRVWRTGCCGEGLHLWVGTDGSKEGWVREQGNKDLSERDCFELT